MISSPWYFEIIPNGPVFSSQTLLKKSVISSRVDGTKYVLQVLSDLFSMGVWFWFFFSFAIILSFYLPVQVLPLSCSGSEPNFLNLFIEKPNLKMDVFAGSSQSWHCLLSANVVR